ncbi:protein phosphatase 2C domain-containing protein [Cohnella rhizosphaerae]|uniref:Protein phosphatase 2C domain-containing protein n=1 Tax=Cohnella rhizosphaerae TaxID=1457232 RepID=A0A9X4KNV6_9BACL|nr:protein phosphatase 2C domain-containing protein [Cohnella rhizosphaerae]MDG0808052.1 protein phosphatase 2C domain-containing protein [Cohnella rhizosphaerae]
MHYEWIGDREPFLDEISVNKIGNIHVGRFGGSTENGATKNEDALFILKGEDQEWTLAVILDAHNSTESSRIILELFKNNRAVLSEICTSNRAFRDLEPYILRLLSEESFKAKCKAVTGETSCLICFQFGSYIWWLSIGDCMAFLFHPELAKFSQFGLNQRQFYEWIGEVNTFELSVPCYVSGRRQLRKDTNLIVLITDGVFEYEDGYYENHRNLYNRFFNGMKMEENIDLILRDLLNDHVKDSTTIISWQVINKQPVQYPSD